MTFIRQTLLGLVIFLAAPSGAMAKNGDSPPNPFVHKGTCPFECCTYRDWKTLKKVTLLDKPKGTRKIVDIGKGKIVRGVTGVVYSRPIRLVATHAYEDSPIKKGELFYALHGVGEGFWAVWYRGKVYSVDFSSESETILDAADPKWWVKIRARNGKSGWVLNRDQFGNQDACG